MIETVVRPALLSAFLATGVGAAGAAGAQVVEAYYGDAAGAECVSPRQGVDCEVLYVDHIVRRELTREVGTLLVGNPAIADVSLISDTDVAISARSVGATNIIFLGDDSALIAEMDVVVREMEDRRLILRRGAARVELFQCAPRCERTLTQLDSPDTHAALSGTIDRENSAATTALSARAQ